jgi:hypothetical protein
MPSFPTPAQTTRAPPIMPSINRYWHKAWTVDLANHTATHEIGLVVRFDRSGEGWDGKPTAESAEAAFNAAMRDKTQTEAEAYMARLMREAGDAWTYALGKAEYDASTENRKHPHNPNKPKKIL